MANVIIDSIKEFGLNKISRGIFLLVMVALIIAFYKSPYTEQIRNMKSFKQSGGAIDSTIGMILLMGLTIMAFVLTFKSINMTTLLFIVLFLIIGFIVTGNFVLSLAIAIILSTIVIAYSSTGEYSYEDRETFEASSEEETAEDTESAESDESAKPKKKEKKESYAQYADEPEETTQETKKESFKLPKPKTQMKEEDIAMDDDEEEEKFIVDQKESLIDIYKGLSKDQVSGMRKDTVELMKTQQELIQTLNSMGPVLQQSKGILSSFQNYFGNDEDMKKKLSQLSDV